MMKKIKVFVAGLVLSLIVLLGGFYGYLNKPVEKSLAGVASGAFNVIGTRVGTTTTGGGFYGAAATNGSTSMPFNIGTQTDSVNFTIRLIGASTTPSSIFTWAVLGSNDFNCETASTTTTANNQVIKKDVNWYKLGGTDMGQLTNSSGAATGTTVSFTNLTFQCLNFEANGSSTVALVQMITKDNK